MNILRHIWTDLAEVLYLKLFPFPMVTFVSDFPELQMASEESEDNIGKL